MLICFSLSIGAALAQNRAIQGKVVDEGGEPVIGASVTVKGNASVGTVTDLEGQFKLSVPAEAQSLIVKYLGMKDSEAAVADNVNVALQPADNSLDEVMVVAYGTAKKSSFTGSAASISAEKINARSVSNVTNALSGQVAGVQVANTGGGQPGTAAAIRIRGFGSMSASNAPLYIVDGAPYDGNIAAINSGDIEKMTVLKDAAATAIYGARGANGVVLITTKSGKTGEARVTVNAKWGSNSRAIPNYAVMTDPGMYYETYFKGLYNSQIYNGGSAAEAYKYANDNAISRLGYQVYTVPNGERLIGTNLKLNPNATLGYSDDDYYYTPDNWYDELFDKGNLRQEYNISVSGAKDKLSYYISLGYLDDSGIIPASGFKRYSGTAKGNYQAKSWLKIGANIGITEAIQQSPTSQLGWGSSGNAFYAANMVAPIYPMYVRKPDGTVKVDDRGLTVYDYGNNTNNYRAFMPMGNPKGDLVLNKYDNNWDVATSKWDVELKPIDELTITGTLSANVLNQRYSYLYNPFYGSSASAGGQVEVENDRYLDVNQQYLAKYLKTFADVHNVDVLVGYETYSRKMQQLFGSRQKIYNPDAGELSNAIQWPPTDMGSKTDTYVTEGFLGRVQYNYDEKYFASGSFRRDASSRFHPDNRWGNFGSGGLAWLISKENFLSDIDWIDELKLKVSYGVQGNDALLYRNSNPNYYAYANQYEISNSNDDFAVAMTYLGNKDITWETSYSFNAGTEFDFFDKRLSGSVEYFSRTTDGLLYYQPLPVSSGFDYKPMNVGSMLNRGVEIELNGVVYEENGIEASLFANATFVHNEILDLIKDAKDAGGIKGSNYIYKVGGSQYQLYMAKWAGVDPETGKNLFYIDPDKGNYKTTDVFTDAKQADLGNTLPAVYGGFGADFKAYGFDLSCQFAYQLGGNMYDGSYSELMHSAQTSDAGLNWHKDILNSWTPENPNTNVPRLGTDDVHQQQSSRFVISSNYLSLNNVVLGYTLPSKLTNKVQISSLRLFVSGDNLALFSARQGLDPRTEWGLGSSTTSGNFRYSALRTLSGGISLTF
ncbi:SusC/RagA family TonB-linked outer membrane protein [Bacteroidia bacterium]|nr:SusC/RagA family TonB-linked outer membrane protein [Bacteroidia bacterium]